MKKITFILSAFVFIAFLEVSAQNNTETSIHFETNSWTEIVTKAKTENKLIFLDAYASWCGPCKYMTKNIFTNSDVAGFYNNNFINAKIDMEKGEGKEIAKKYDVRNYPTFLFIDGDGKIVHQACGAREAKAFVSLGEMAFKDQNNTSSYMRQFKGVNKQAGEELTASFMHELVTVLAEACISTNEPLNEYFDNLSFKDHFTDENAILIFEHVKNYDNSGFQSMVKYGEDFSKFISKDQISNKIKDVYSYSLKNAAKDQNRIEFDKIHRQVKASDLKMKDELVLKGNLHWAKYKKDWNSYVNSANQYVPKYALEDYKELNSIAWTYYENVDDKTALENSLEWIQVSISLKQEYSNQDTFAALLYKLGKKNDAIEAANLAISIAEQEGIDAEDTIMLLEKINALN